MKHGQKKGKAKATPPGKKSKSAKKSKATQSGRIEKSGAKAETRPAAKSDGKGRGGVGETITFNNPVVAAAFKRAVKKYPTAFRRLTD